MLRAIILRTFQSFMLIIFISIISFALVNMAPGLPAIAVDPNIPLEDQERMLDDLGLNDPLPERYVAWISDLLRGDLGESFQYQRPVWDLIKLAIPPTLLLAGSSFLLAIIVAIPIGVLSAIHSYSILDYLVTSIAFIGVSLPGFWFGILLILLFGVSLGWLPTSGMTEVGQDPSFWDTLRHLILPMIVVSTAMMAPLTRYVRSSMREVIGQDYVLTARAKGLHGRTVLGRHAMRNALFPVITVIGLMIPWLLGGQAVLELVFAWPGVGRLAIVSALQRDYPVVLSITMMISILTILSNVFVDFAYQYLDPRLGHDSN